MTSDVRGKSTDPRHLEMLLAQSRHQKIASPSQDCLELQLAMIYPTHNDFYHRMLI